MAINENTVVLSDLTTVAREAVRAMAIDISGYDLSMVTMPMFSQ